jgi:2-oxoglutarate dehydrogenase E1 component
MQVCIPSTPANYFHLLRRQIRRDFRKPLIVISPKSLLRHPQCQSDLSLFYEKDFQRLLWDELPDPVPDDKVKRILLCTGRVYYDLHAERKRRDINDVVIIRVEQICPFPYDLFGDVARKYSNAEIYWVQEEPFNQGSWSYVEPRIVTAIKEISPNKRPFYVGRNAAASPATGSPAIHAAELEHFLNDAFEAEYKHEEWVWKLSDLQKKAK